MNIYYYILIYYLELLEKRMYLNKLKKNVYQALDDHLSTV